MSDLENIASDAVKRALAAGATDAECTIMEGEEFSTAVRMRELESLKEAGSRAAGIRVLVGKHGGSSYTSDLTADGIATMVRGAIDLAKSPPRILSLVCPTNPISALEQKIFSFMTMRSRGWIPIGKSRKQSALKKWPSQPMSASKTPKVHRSIPMSAAAYS